MSILRTDNDIAVPNTVASKSSSSVQLDNLDEDSGGWRCSKIRHPAEFLAAGGRSQEGRDRQEDCQGAEGAGREEVGDANTTSNRALRVRVPRWISGPSSSDMCPAQETL